MKTFVITSHDWASHSQLREQVMALDLMLGDMAWSHSSWQKLSPDSLLLGWGSLHELQGFALYQLSAPEELAHLLKIVIAADRQGSGEAQIFWDQQLAELKLQRFSRVFLEVASDNSRAVSFYRKSGFIVLREAKAFYQNGSNALIMELAI